MMLGSTGCSFLPLRASLDAAPVPMDPGGKPSTAQMLVLASSSALTALFYSIYRKRATTVARLKVSLHSSSF